MNYAKNYNTDITTINLSVDEIRPFSEGFAATNIENRWGFINTKGEIVIPCQYDDVEAFSDGMALIRKNFLWGFIDTKGNFKIPGQYEYAESFNEGYAYVKVGGKKFLIDKLGHNIVDLTEYEGFEGYSNGLISLVDKNNYYGYIDLEGNIVVPFKYSYQADLMSDGYVLMYIDDGYSDEEQTYLVDNKGNELLDFPEEEYSDNYIFYSDKTVISCKNGDDYWTITNCDTLETIPLPNNLYVDEEFGNGYCIVLDQQANKGVIDKKGKLVIPCIYDNICVDINSTVFLALKNKLWGIISPDGKELAPFIFQNISDLSENIAFIYDKKNGQAIDCYGKILFSFQKRFSQVDKGMKRLMKGTVLIILLALLIIAIGYFTSTLE